MGVLLRNGAEMPGSRQDLPTERLSLNQLAAGLSGANLSATPFMQ